MPKLATPLTDIQIRNSKPKVRILVNVTDDSGDRDRCA